MYDSQIFMHEQSLHAEHTTITHTHTHTHVPTRLQSCIRVPKLENKSNTPLGVSLCQVGLTQQRKQMNTE